MLPGYSYVVAKLGPLTITRRSLNLSISGACLTFSVIQSASLTLLTTPEESMARAVAWFLAPLRVLRVPVKQIVLTLLLSLRFMSLVSTWWLPCCRCRYDACQPASGINKSSSRLLAPWPGL